MKYKKVIFLDIDGVLADVHSVWLSRYNADYNDSVNPNNITNWNTHEFVKPECGLKIYEYLKDPSLYDFAPLIPGAIDGVLALRELNLRIAYATATPIEASGRKYKWLVDYGFLDKDDEYIEIRDKSLLRGEFMLDDYTKNVKHFFGTGFLFSRPWNEDYTWLYRVSDWLDFIKKIKDVL